MSPDVRRQEDRRDSLLEVTLWMRIGLYRKRMRFLVRTYSSQHLNKAYREQFPIRLWRSGNTVTCPPKRVLRPRGRMASGRTRAMEGRETEKHHPFRAYRVCPPLARRVRWIRDLSDGSFYKYSGNYLRPM